MECCWRQGSGNHLNLGLQLWHGVIAGFAAARRRISLARRGNNGLPATRRTLITLGGRRCYSSNSSGRTSSFLVPIQRLLSCCSQGLMLLLLMMVVAVRRCGRIVMMWRSSRLGSRRSILVLALVVGGPMALGHDPP